MMVLLSFLKAQRISLPAEICLGGESKPHQPQPASGPPGPKGPKVVSAHWRTLPAPTCWSSCCKLPTSSSPSQASHPTALKEDRNQAGHKPELIIAQMTPRQASQRTELSAAMLLSPAQASSRPPVWPWASGAMSKKAQPSSHVPRPPGKGSFWTGAPSDLGPGPDRSLTEKPPSSRHLPHQVLE